MGPMRDKEGVGRSQSRLQDSIFFPSSSLLTYKHSLSLSHTHTHAIMFILYLVTSTLSHL